MWLEQNITLVCKQLHRAMHSTRICGVWLKANENEISDYLRAQWDLWLGKGYTLFTRESSYCFSAS